MGLGNRSESTLAAALVAGKWGLYGGLLGFQSLEGFTSIRTFSSGALTYTGIADKTRDYTAAAGFLLAVLISFAVTEQLLERMQAKLSVAAFRSLKRSIILANIPAAFALGGIFFSKTLDMKLLLYSTAAEAVLFGCATCWLVLLARTENEATKEASAALDFGWVLPALLFSLLGGTLALPGWTSLFLITTQSPGSAIELSRLSLVSGWITAALCAGACIAIFARKETGSIARYGCFLLCFMQLALIAGGIVLLGPIIQAGNILQYFLTITVSGQVAVALAILTPVVFIIRAALSARDVSNATMLIKTGAILNPVAVVLAAAALKSNFNPPTIDLSDLYHAGEFALPYWGLTNFHLVPYVDLDPVRGWVNLLNGLFGEAFFKPAWTNYAFVAPYLMSVVLLFLFLALRPLIGAWAALFLVCVAPPANSLTEIDLVITGMLSLICFISLRLKAALWIPVWILIGTAAVLFAPGQGGLLVLSTGVLGIARIIEAVREDKRRLAQIITALLVATALLLLTPVGASIVGAVRYGIEQSAVNTEMNSVAWKVGVRAPRGPFWEAVRMSWLLVTAGIGISVLIGLRRHLQASSSSKLLGMIKSPYFFVGIPIVILGFLFIPRAAGRIDPGGLSRMGIASFWFVTILLPFYFFVSRRPVSGRPLIVLGFAAMTGLFGSLLNYTWFAIPFDRIMHVGKQADIANGHAIGLDQMGPYLKAWSLDSVKKAASMKAFLDARLSSKDTFVDLTSQNGLYYLLNRPPPIASSVYNLTTVAQQLRAIASLEQRAPALALAGPNPILHDGGVLGLRTPVLYRYVVENYRPIEGGGAIWLVPSAHTTSKPDRAIERSEVEMALLDRVFGQRDLAALPRLWGQAWSYLKAQLEPVGRADIDSATLHDAVRLPNGTVVARGPDPYIVLDTTSLGMSGSEAGVISFDFICENPTSRPVLELVWSTANGPKPVQTQMVSFEASNGRIVVPVDASPSWVLGGLITSVRFNLRERSSCPAWRVSDLSFSQRSHLRSPSTPPP